MGAAVGEGGRGAPTLFAPRGLQNTMWELYIDIACGSFAIDAAPTRQWLSPAAGYHLPSAAGLAAFERMASAISLPSMLQPPELGRRRTYLKWWRRERGEGRGVVRGVGRGCGAEDVRRVGVGVELLLVDERARVRRDHLWGWERRSGSGGVERRGGDMG